MSGARSTGEDAAGSRAAGDPDLGLEGRYVDAARQQDPRHGGGFVELGAGLSPALPIRDRRVIREFGLQHVPADRGQPTGGLDDDPPTRLSGELLAGDDGEGQRLDEEGQVGGSAGAGNLVDELLLGGGVRRVGVVVDQELGGRCAHPLRLPDAPAIEDAADAGGRRSLESGRLDRDDQAGSRRQRPVCDALGRADLGVEQGPGGDGCEGAHDRSLELDHLLVRHRRRVVGPQLAAEVLAMVEGKNGERAARGRARLEPSPGADAIGAAIARPACHDWPSRRTRRALSR